jgi:HD superfamily phosphohydrolase
MNKKKIFNDPIYGLIRFPFSSLYEIIDHPCFQRLRRISQQALSHYVYPGALHTRFQHALGATYLMTRAIETIRAKGTEVSDQEYEAVCTAILLHDVGHGPFSHALEHSLAGVHHEEISLVLMEVIGNELNIDLGMAISMFKGTYHRPFFHQLVSGQIDTDRMDYLTRDSFFSGVAEGIIGYDRIITMMAVSDDRLVIEEKGIASIEKFLLARRLMYWQVYLHKTVISAETMLIALLRRARELTVSGDMLAASDELFYFLNMQEGSKMPISDPEFIKNFVQLDDMDLLWMIKKSVHHKDFVFSTLCRSLLERKLLKVLVCRSEEDTSKLAEWRKSFEEKYSVGSDVSSFFFTTINASFTNYISDENEISILMKDGNVLPYSAVQPIFTPGSETRMFGFYPTFM